MRMIGSGGISRWTAIGGRCRNDNFAVVLAKAGTHRAARRACRWVPGFRTTAKARLARAATLHGVVFNIFWHALPRPHRRWVKVSCPGRETRVFRPVQPHVKKNSCSQLCAKHLITPAVSSHKGAYHDRHGRGMGCGGRSTRRAWPSDGRAGCITTRL
jgi:hypothetical protein